MAEKKPRRRLFRIALLVISIVLIVKYLPQIKAKLSELGILNNEVNVEEKE